MADRSITQTPTKLQEPPVHEHRHTILNVLLTSFMMGGDKQTLASIAVGLGVGEQFVTQSGLYRRVIEGCVK